MNTICVIDDEESITSTVASILRDEGFEVAVFRDAEGFWRNIENLEPAMVLLDVWLPGMDGMQLLKRILERYPNLPVIMMSGHAGIDAAVAAIKAGAYDFLEKPLHLGALIDKVVSALKQRPADSRRELPSDMRLETAEADMDVSPDVVEILDSSRPQRTIKKDVVLNGIGLLSGKKTALILSPLEIDRGIIFQTLDGDIIPGHITSLENASTGTGAKTFTANSTVLASGRRRVRTVEHLMAALSMYGITNVLARVGEEIPNIDGSAKDFCELIESAGIVDQDASTRVAAIRRKIGVGKEDQSEKYIYAEPYEGFSISMRVDYPPPIGEQVFEFEPAKVSFFKEIAPARSFNTFESIETAQKLGKVGGGYLNSHIILYDGKVINTQLRYPDEFVRHKILDLIGDLYLLGIPIQGRITANMTSHGYNQALVQRLYQAVQGNLKRV